jgi:hypothetical protein
LWGFLKERAHRNRPRATEELKRAIQVENALIDQDQDLLRRVLDHFVDRLKQPFSIFLPWRNPWNNFQVSGNPPA